MPLQETSGNLTTDAFGGGVAVAVVPNYIEDVFSTWLYTGTGASLPIVNNIDLSTYGGLVWLKQRNGGNQHILEDSARGITGSNIVANSASAAQPSNDSNGANNVITSLDTTGFTLGTGSGFAASNVASSTYVSWTFRKKAKFFDVVTYTGTGSNTTISHNLGSTPGFVIVKRTDTTGDWYCNIVAFTGWTDYLVLNSTAARATDTTVWNSTSPTSTTFSVGTNAGVNANGGTYVAYLFATDAGGFGLTGTDSVIKTLLVSSAGSGNTTVNLGFEPQFLMFKKTASTSDWFIYDTMRGMAYSTGAATLKANTSGAETTGISVVPTATGFVAALDNSFTYFCLAIRRGPMKVPTDGTKVFKPFTYTTPSYQDTGTPIDSVLVLDAQTANVGLWGSRLVGTPPTLDPRTTNQETSGFSYAFQQGQGTSYYPSGVFGEKTNSYGWSRSPKFFDEVCYTGTGSATTFNHNLGAVPELIICKSRSVAGQWPVYSAGLANTEYLNLEAVDAKSTGTTVWNSTTPTASVFSLGSSIRANQSGTTYVAYLFATCAGVSKVGSFTGTGATQTIDCGFGASGARFVLIKRTDTSGNWYSFNSSSGFTSGSSPYMVWNGAATAETTGNNGCFAASTGFTVTSTASSTVNINGGNYIFLAIA